MVDITKVIHLLIECRLSRINFLFLSELFNTFFYHAKNPYHQRT